MDKMDKHELISALADGQLRGEAFAQAVELTAADAEARAAWCSYHVIGEALRSGQPAAGTASDLFLARLQQRLQDEPAAPVRPAAAQAVVVAAAAPAAANDWLWKLVAGVASVAAVGAVAWNVWAPGAGGNAAPQLAAAPAPSVAAVPVATDARGTMTMIRDPRLDQLLAAHRQLGGAGALQTPSGFLRNATFEGPAR